VTVTVCGWFQSAGANVNTAGWSVASASFPLIATSVTSAFGRAVNTTVKVSVVPDSETSSAALLRTKPPMSSSRVLT